MKMETRNHNLGAASCRIAQSNALPVRMRSKTRELSRLFVKPDGRRCGDATALMHKVCAEADMCEIVLVLFADPFESEDLPSKTGPDAARLKVWYSKTFGFQEIAGTPGLMARMPGATPRMLQMPLVTGMVARAMRPEMAKT